MSDASATDLYLDLMKRCLTGAIYPDLDGEIWPKRFLQRKLLRALFPSDVRCYRRISPEERGVGQHWPSHAHTMIGLQRLDNIQFCVEDVLKGSVPGDLIETGVWRGGTCIFMRGILKAHGVTRRKVWVADSFQGLPKPDPKYPADAGDLHFLVPELAVSLEQVQDNFRIYGLLDEQVRFLKGWFKDTLPTAPIEMLAVARLDGDLYESTMDALANLYPKLSVGGYLILDDYNVVPGCKKAVHDFRDAHGIKDEIRDIDGSGAFWQRTSTA